MFCFHVKKTHTNPKQNFVINRTPNWDMLLETVEPCRIKKLNKSLIIKKIYTLSSKVDEVS